MTVIEAIETARRNGDFAALVAAVPYASYLGVSAGTRKDRLITRLPFVERNIGNPVLPALHGGVVGGFLELAAVFELLWSQEQAAIPKTVNITVDYLRPAGPRGCFARGTVTKLGRRVANVRVEAWQDDQERPIAHGHVHVLLSSAPR